MPLVPSLAQAPATTRSASLDVGDAGAVVDATGHAVLVTSCAIDKRGCLLAQPSSTPDDATYRVVFGGGAGSIRSRGQAMAELYKEIRDRTGAGGHLSAEPHHIGDPRPGAEAAKAAPRPRKTDDPLVEAAFQLMDAVDHDGELTIDSLPMRSANSCRLALGVEAEDGGSSRCLVNAPAPSVVSPTQHAH
jgi:hypothetical protein